MQGLIRARGGFVVLALIAMVKPQKRLEESPVNPNTVVTIVKEKL
ncbi:hypothetical protein BSPWISOXPB_112 [uncultured Gammaproteobacteria bacterium]|nr:hypothetical protein BSPWISOXPB_112 [uncultured Gammaproteobacteria bacterium]